MSRAIFVSDIHIGTAEDPRCLLFLRLLDQCRAQKINEIFLVGDIFDLWISDRRYFTEHYQNVIEKIRGLRLMGVKIHYFEGNHDLDLRRYWQHHLGVDVYSEAAFFTLNGLKFRIEHGDQMDRNDRGYLFLRWLLRTPPLVILQRYLPDSAVGWIGRRASRASRDYTTQVKTMGDDEVRETMRAHARRMFAQIPFDVFVSGHVHVVDESQQSVGIQNFICVNLGTWLKTPMIGELKNQTFHLVSLDQFLSSP